jgi:hypothetical protein
MDPIEELREASARGAAKRTADLAAGHARIGGLWSRPDYLRSYLAAARVLAREARASNSFNELAVACAYQQRHTLELALKWLIEMFHDIATNNDEIASITYYPGTTSTAPSKGEAERRTQCHDLDQLLRDLRAAHKREVDAGSNYQELSGNLAALVDDFTTLENRQPSRLRYPTIYVKQEKRHESSFQDEIVIPIERLQGQLESIIDELFGDDDFSKPSDCLARQLADVDHAQCQVLWSLGAYDVPDGPT